jgi:hypothetical protein
MRDMPGRAGLRRLARRLAIGLFLEVWPGWAVAGLLLSGIGVVVCRLFFPKVAPDLPWLWLAPLVAILPALVVCSRRWYRPEQIVAIADWLGGGNGLLLTLHENPDPRWTDAPIVEAASRFALPAPAPRRRLAPLAPACAFLAAALWLPQRTPPAVQGALADDIARDLTTALAELKQQELVTPEEEKRIEEEIERIRRSADQRVDASSWEAADGVKERMVSDLSAKRDALKWAEESLARFDAAAQGGNAGESAAAQAAELTQALEQLAKSGLLAGAPQNLTQLMKGGKLPADPKALRELAASLSKYLGETKGRFGDLAKLGKDFGRFDPAEFPLAGEGNAAGPRPGRGGLDRGRADADLMYGKESLRADRFKATPLPPGAPRSPDDWAPVVELPGTPQESAVLSTLAAARRYDPSAGQSAWRRTLAPRHHSALKKYFAK